MTDRLPCICGHHLMYHNPSGRCHGTYGIAAMYCNCWAYRTEAEAAAAPQPGAICACGHQTAAGDGVTDDTDAIQWHVNHGLPYGQHGIFVITRTLVVAPQPGERERALEAALRQWYAASEGLPYHRPLDAEGPHREYTCPICMAMSTTEELLRLGAYAELDAALAQQPTGTGTGGKG